MHRTTKLPLGKQFNSKSNGGKKLLLPIVNPSHQTIEQSDLSKYNKNVPNFFSSDKKKLNVQKKDIKKKFINRYEYENNWKKVNSHN